MRSPTRSFVRKRCCHSIRGVNTSATCSPLLCTPVRSTPRWTPRPPPRSAWTCCGAWQWISAFIPTSSGPNGRCGPSTESSPQRLLPRDLEGSTVVLTERATPRMFGSWHFLIGQRGEKHAQLLLFSGGQRHQPLTLAAGLLAHRLVKRRTTVFGQLEPDQSAVGAVADPRYQTVTLEGVQRTGDGRARGPR